LFDENDEHRWRRFTSFDSYRLRVLLHVGEVT
jgi:hypothetical protein